MLTKVEKSQFFKYCNILYKIYFTGFDKIVQLLIDKGAHINAAENEYNSALVFAAQKGKN